MYAKYFINTHEYSYANYHIDECLKILPDYYPAKKIKSRSLRIFTVACII